MKKWTVILTVFALILSLCACGGNGANDDQAAQELQVGYARAKIMPETQVPMSSGSSNPLSDGYRDYLYVTCIALTYGDETVLLITQDLLNAQGNPTNMAKDAITEATGITADRIMICSTHTHSCPRMNIGDERIVEYTENIYAPAMAAAAKEALEDRAPATLSGAKTETEGMNFVRHYKMSDGTYAGDNFGSFSKAEIVEHATVGDPEMLLVKIDREGEKQDILLMNWQAHPCLTKEYNIISADFVGTTRDTIEKETGMLFAYFTGDAGNQNTFSKISTENNHLDVEKFGEKLAQYAIDALETMQPLEGDGIRVSQVQLEYATNKANIEKLAQAKEVAALWETSGIDAANALAEKYGISSWVEARYITQRERYPETDVMELSAVYVGGMAFVTAPYEMFTDNGIYIKENSPFEMTMVFSCANNSHGYCPTETAFEYESYEASSSYFAKGIGEAAAFKFVEMLNGLQ